MRALALVALLAFGSSGQHQKIILTDKDDRACAEWNGIRKCVTAQQIMYIGAKERP